MTITPQMVKTLRDKTGAGMADCKKALSENDGNMDAAIVSLEKGASISANVLIEAKEGAVIARRRPKSYC